MNEESNWLPYSAAMEQSGMATDTGCRTRQQWSVAEWQRNEGNEGDWGSGEQRAESGERRTMSDKTPNLQASLARLFARRRFGMKPGLDTIRSLAKELDNPENSFGIIHIAGTNGKGSTAAIIESILRSAGFSVGLYTSPHLVRFNERIRINGEPISDEDLVSLMETVEKCSNGSTDNKLLQEPTFFELTTAMAFEGFRRAGVSLAVIETGIGGRLDATNIVNPLISVITRISREHTHCLGEDLLSIAGEKCGIIKQGRPVVCGAQEEDVKRLIKKTADKKDAFLAYADDVIGIQKLGISLDGQKITVESTANSYGTIHFPLSGSHQLENLATALAVIERLFDLLELPLDREFVRKGVAGVIWPGRFQTISKSPRLILDAAHNTGGAKAVAATLKSCGEKGIGLVLGMCKDKENVEFLKCLRPYVKKTWMVPLSNERGMSPGELALMARTTGMQSETGTLPEMLELAESWAQKEGGTVLITGSLFLLGDVLTMRSQQNDKNN